MNKKSIFTSRTYFIVLATLFVAQQITILIRFAKNFTNLDQTLLWYAGNEFIHFRLHQPNFYGQKYNTIYEAVPGQVLHHIFGVSLAVAVPLGTIGIVSLIWLLLAAMTYKNNHKNLALLALAIPTILRLQYLLLFDAPRGILAGDLLAVIAVALAFWIMKDTVFRLSSLIVLGGLAIAWDFSTALIVVPAFLYLAIQHQKQLLAKPKRLVLLAFAAIPPVAWILFDQHWYKTHPYDLTNQSVSIKPIWWVFKENIHHFSSYFAYFAPAILPVAIIGALIVCATLLGVLALSVKIRSKPLFASSLSVIVLTLLALSLERSLNTVNTAPGLFLSASRLFIFMPVALFFLVFLAALSLKPSVASRLKFKQVHSYFGVCLILLTAISFTASQVNFSSITNKAVAQNLSGGLLGEANMVAPCPVIYKNYIANKAELFATTNPVIAYGCAAQYSTLNTFDTPADRRGWIVKRSFDQPSTRLLVEGSNCTKAVEIGATCTVLEGNLLFIQTPPQPAAHTLSKLGFPVRSYTNHYQ